MTTQGFALHVNRPKARTVSPTKLAAFGIGLASIILAAFLVPGMMGKQGGGKDGQNQSDRADMVSLVHRFGFEDAPRNYSDLGTIDPVSVFSAPAVLDVIEPEPRIIIKEIIREVPGQAPPSPKPDEDARQSPVVFSSLIQNSTSTSVTLLGPRTLPVGHRLKARLDGAINSETPGLVTATVIQDPRGLVPTGAKLIGRYDGGAIRFTGSRLPIRFSELQVNNRALVIEAQAADADGRAGLEGDVDRHMGALLGLSALNVVSGAAIGSTARRGDDFEAALAGESIREGARLSRDTGRQILSVAPTIEIPAGTEFSLVLLATLRL